MPGKHDGPMMGHEPKMMSEKQKIAGKAFAEKIANKMGYDLVPKDVRAKMAMPKKNTPMNFKEMDIEMAKAMDYNNGKPMMYGDKPKMDHGPKMYGKPKMAHGDKPKMGHKPKAYHDKK